VGFFVLSFFRFKRFLFIQPKTTAEDINGLDLELKEGETYVLLTGGNVINNQLYNFFSGEAKAFKEMVRLNDINLALEENKSKRRDFTYLCHPGKVPGDINVGDFITFIKNLLKASNKAISELYIGLGLEHIENKCFMEISVEEAGRILLAAAQMKKRTIYMFQDFVRGMSADFMKRFIEELQTLKDQGVAILYLTDDVLLASKIGDSAGSLRATTPPKLDNYNLV
jgi:ABC-type multidrug transport system ATPase subunit